MSRLSIYESRWIDLVFENRNKEYGAYQLRRESVKSSLTALFMGLLFVASLGAISKVSSYFQTDVKPPITIFPDIIDTKIHLSDIVPPKTDNTIIPEIKDQAPPASTIDKKQLINPVITQASQATPEIATNLENRFTSNTPSEGTGTTVNPGTTGGGGTGTEVISKTGDDGGNTLATPGILDKMPEFPGGLDKFYKYVGNNFEKPEIENVNSLRIYVSFVIEKDGSMTDIKVLKDPGYGLGREAIRVLKSLKTKWAPGILDSKPVRTAYNLPIIIQIENQ